MDPEGYLPVTLVASFNRVRSLTNDVTFIVDSVQDSTVVEVKDGKFRPIDDPDSWPIAADQPDPVLSPKPEVQLDPTPDPPPPTSTTNTTTSVAPTVVVASSHDLESAKTTLNPNVPEFVPSFASAQGWFHCFFSNKKIDTYFFKKQYILIIDVSGLDSIRDDDEAGTDGDDEAEIPDGKPGSDRYDRCLCFSILFIYILNMSNDL